MTTAKKEAKAKFVVIMPNTLDHKVGDVIDLTKRQAQNLKGKVRLAKDVEASARAQNAVKEAEKILKENDSLKEENQVLKDENEALQSQVDELTAKLKQGGK